jgi:hypothetical protein
MARFHDTGVRVRISTALGAVQERAVERPRHVRAESLSGELQKMCSKNRMPPSESYSAFSLHHALHLVLQRELAIHPRPFTVCTSRDQASARYDQSMHNREHCT